MNLVVKAGPYFAFGFAGKVNADDSYGSYDGDVFGDEIGAKRFELGVDLGVDFEFKRWVVGAEYEIGITPLIKEDGATARNSAFYVTAGYKF